MGEEVVIHECSHIGVAGTTAVHVKRSEDGSFVARCGVAIMGSTNMDEEGFKACNYNPFHGKFQDNYAEGMGKTEAEALDALKADMHQMADSLWADFQ
jgi:hypothetical protein